MIPILVPACPSIALCAPVSSQANTGVYTGVLAARPDTCSAVSKSNGRVTGVGVTS